jgi:hypothetical protein
MFGNPPNPGFLGSDNDFKGDQVRGYGFLNDGSLDTVFRFVHGISFSEVANGPGSRDARPVAARSRPCAPASIG